MCQVGVISGVQDATVVNLPALLIGVSLVAGLGLLLIRGDGWRRWWVAATTALLAVGSIALASGWAPIWGDVPGFSGHAVGTAMLGLEIAMGLYIIVLGIRHRRPLVVLLLLVQPAVALPCFILTLWLPEAAL